MFKNSLIALIFLFSISVSAQSSQNSEENLLDQNIPEKVLNTVLSILQDNPINDLKSNFTPDAYLINSDSYLSVFEVFNDSVEKAKFIESKNVRVGVMRLTIPNNKENAYMVLETKSENEKSYWHSIYFNIDENSEWKIASWHKS